MRQKQNRILEIWAGQSTPRRWAFAFCGVALLLALGLTFDSIQSGDGVGEEGLIGVPITEVQSGPLTISLVESGTIRPRRQIVLKNETGDPAAILFIVPEGKRVKQGELLAELDVTQLENDVVERRIRVQNDEADLIHAEENLKVVENQSEADFEQAELNSQFAQQDLEKYLEGEYPRQLKEAETRITLAKEELSRAQEDLKWSQVLYEQEYSSQAEFEQDELAAKKAQLNLELAEADLDLLKTYTYPRQVDQLQSDVRQAKLALERTQRLAKANLAQAKAAVAARQAELSEEQSRLEREEDQLSKARLYAPIDGMVLYATSVREQWRRDAEPIEVGTIIRERDEIIYLPTDSEYNVDIKITEVDLAKIKPGLSVRMTVDAIPDQVLEGIVKDIAQLPDSQSRYLNPNLKLYETAIELSPSQAPIRNGMSCRAEIMVDYYPNALFVPIQTVTRLGGQTVVYAVEEGGVVTPREVTIGLDNSRFIHIRAGLEEGERILLAPPLTSNADEAQETVPDDEVPAGSGEPPEAQPEPPPGQPAADRKT